VVGNIDKDIKVGYANEGEPDPRAWSKTMMFHMAFDQQPLNLICDESSDGHGPHL
jgi:hypothetical protein